MSDTTKTRVADLASRYMLLTKETMPALAKSSHQHWPVRHDHCFQRIVLDAICGGVWYDHLARPAYKNLNYDQAKRAVALCEAIMSGDVDLDKLNHQSLIWRGKGGTQRN